MKTICFSLLLAILASAPFDGATAAPIAGTETTLASADYDSFGGAYKFKRKKRKKNRNMRRKHNTWFGR